MEAEPAMLTVEELAKLMRVNKKTVYLMIQAGEISQAQGLRRFRNTIRIHRESATAWLNTGSGVPSLPSRRR